MKETKYKEECEMLDREIKYSSVVKQTYDEKYDMYMKLPKKKLAEMLIECNNALNKFYDGSKINTYSIDELIYKGHQDIKAGSLTFSNDPEMATLGKAY